MFYTFDDWKNFLQTSFCLCPVKPCLPSTVHAITEHAHVTRWIPDVPLHDPLPGEFLRRTIEVQLKILLTLGWPAITSSFPKVIVNIIIFFLPLRFVPVRMLWLFWSCVCYMEPGVLDGELQFNNRAQDKLKYRSLLLRGPGESTQKALRGRLGRWKQGTGGERGKTWGTHLY